MLFGLSFLAFFLGLPALLIISAPKAWVRLTAAILVLFSGLFWLDVQVATPAPYDDDGFGDFLAIGAMDLLILGTICGVAARLQSVFAQEEERRSDDALWPWPLGILVAAWLLHWLSNRLAGQQPSVLIHLAVIGVAMLVGAANWAAALRRSLPAKAAFHLVAATSLGLAVMVVNDARLGFGAWWRAEREAGTKPHCLMTYGGFEHRRRAMTGWDLSPLVNRHYGTWAASKAPMLVIADEGRIRTLRLIGGHFSAVDYVGTVCRPD